MAPPYSTSAQAASPVAAAPSSLWSRAATVFFLGAALTFGMLWGQSVTSGLEQLVARSMSVVLFGVLWVIGVLCLVVGAWRAHRHGWRPIWPRPALLLLVAAPLVCGWAAFGRATPERLVRSAGRGDLASVERCLRRGVGVDERYSELLGFGGRRTSSTALGAAAESGRLDVVDALIGAGADLEALGAGRRTPCEVAIAGGHLEVVARLLRAGARLGSERGDRPHPMAAALSASPQRGYPLEAMLRTLQEYGADPIEVALLREAMWLPGPTPARVLVAVSASARAAAGPEWELLRALVRADDEEQVRLYMELSGRAAADDAPRALEDVELLQLAAKFGCASFVRHLLDGGMAVDALGAGGGLELAPLHHAVVEGHTATVELLVQRGADIERRSGSWGTALYRACAAGHVEVVSTLLASGSDVNARRSEALADTPLFACLASRSVPIARLLLAAGADPAARDFQGRTAAEQARSRGAGDLAELLRAWSD